MPDHLHFLAPGRSADADLLKFVSLFKQKTGFEYQQRFGNRLWRPKYYEHIARAAEQLESVAVYIWNNPARAGICARAIDYELAGSTTIDWKERCRYLGEWTPPWKGNEKTPG